MSACVPTMTEGGVRPDAIPAPAPLWHLVLRSLAFLPIGVALTVLRAMLAPLAPRAAACFLAAAAQTALWGLGVRVAVRGRAMPEHGGPPVLLVANHTSFLDIPALAASAAVRFVAKTDVARVPFFRLVAWLGGTLFIARARARADEERDAVAAHLAPGFGLVLFPEGGIGGITAPKPYASSLLAAAFDGDGVARATVQPVAIRWDAAAGRPTDAAARLWLGWTGKQGLVENLRRVLGARPTTLTVAFLDPVLRPGEGGDRKAVTLACRDATAHAIV